MKPVYYEDGALKMLDQTLLPTEEIIHSYTDYREIAQAIVDMIVRGAPAIGVTAGYGVYFGAEEFKNLPSEDFLAAMETVCETLRGTRPTAVNLFWAVDRMAKVIEDHKQESPIMMQVWKAVRISNRFKMKMWLKFFRIIMNGLNS